MGLAVLIASDREGRADDPKPAARPTVVLARAAADSAAEPATEAGASAAGVPRQPQAAIDRQGRVFVVFGVDDTIRCVVSTDQGRSFGEPVLVATSKVLSLGRRRGPRIAVTDRGLVVSAISGEQGRGRDGDLLTWRSTDLGRTWEGPVRVNTVAGAAREGLHGMAGRPDGTVYCTWLDLRNNRTELWGARSRDGGASWEPDALVYRAKERNICECCHPSVAFGPAPGNDLVLMWRNQLAGDRDLYLIRSSDAGSHFGPAQKLGEGSWHLDACPMDGGAVAIAPGGRVSTVWRRGLEVFSSEPGLPERKLGDGSQPWVAEGSSGPVAVWLSGRVNAPQGATLKIQTAHRDTPAPLAEHAGFPVVVAGPEASGPVVAIWENLDGRSIEAAVIEP
jgi:hypothetical protein